MTVGKVFQFIGVSLIPVVVTVLLYIGFKHVEKHCYSDPNKKLSKLFKTEKSRYWFKQIVTGLILGGFSIGAFYLGVEVKNYLGSANDKSVTIAVTTFFPVMSGFVFGWPSAAITTLVAFVFRICIPSFLRWATVAACLIGGFAVVLTVRFILNGKRSKWYYAFFGGLFVESLNMLLLFLFNLRHISDAYRTLKQFDIVCILCNAVASGLACLIVQIIEKDKITINPKKDRHISGRIQLSLFLICLCGLIFSTSTTYIVTYFDAYDSSVYQLNNCSYDMHKDFKTMKAPTSPINCVNRHIVSQMGYVLTAAAEEIDLGGLGSEVLHEGDLAGVPNAVQRDFGVKYGTPFKFDDGTTLKDCPMSVIHDEYKRSTFKYFDKSYCGEFCLVSYSKEICPAETEGGKQYSYYSIVIIPYDEILVSSGISHRVVLYLDMLMFIFLFALTNLLISKRLISNIETMDKSLEKIMDGDLNEEITLKRGYKEFETLSTNINLAVGALKTYAAEVEHRLTAELIVARDIQVGSLPTRFPVEKEYNLHALMNTAKEVGGDFYDYIKMNNGRILILNADVSGKGVPAAMFMMRAKTLFKSLASTTSNLSEIVYNVNNVLCEDNELDMFVTAWVGIFNPETGELNYVNAGHTIPLIKVNGKFEQFVNKHNVALAAIPNSKFEVETIYLEPGQEIILYTDGVTESINAKTEMYGMDRLIHVANTTNYFNAKQLLTNISDDIAKFANGVEQFDDITMLMLIYTGKQEENPENTLTLIAKPVSTTVAINYVESVLASRELNPKFIARISIVIDELFANIAFYAYPKGKEGNATVTIDTRDDMLKIRLIDSGAPFDPTAKEDPDVTATIDERKRGGLGIFIVKNTMDDVRYEYTNFQNILYLDKKITPEDKIAKKEVKEPKGE